ncbi:MAG: class I SAM-dependent methyltransferase [Methanomassiliicoccales archaeon]|jgi:ubiquinone/menaquinone biosynthesis C-methylase UbiE|nr:class I SAM-dependent methyltransferase [Methanomassiliicoccales archaeon]
MYSRIFDKIAGEYNRWYETHKEIFLCETEAIKSFNLRGLGLEVAIGTGSIASEVGINVGVDPSYPMLLYAKDKGIDVVQALGETLPFKNEIFDFVLISTTLCFVVDRISVMKEVHRVLKGKGRVVVCFIPRDSVWGRYYIEKGRHGHRIYRHARFLSLDEIIELLETSCFVVKKIVSTLRFGPEDEPTIECPMEGIANGGFVCVEAEKK